MELIRYIWQYLEHPLGPYPPSPTYKATVFVLGRYFPLRFSQFWGSILSQIYVIVEHVNMRRRELHYCLPGYEQVTLSLSNFYLIVFNFVVLCCVRDG